MRGAVARSLRPLVVFSVIIAITLSGYVVAGAAPSDSFEMMVAFVWAILLAWWIVRDARCRAEVPCFDFGLFCYAFLPLSVPCYCLWSRGWRGFGMLTLILAIWIAPYLVANIVWWVRYG